MCSCPISEFLSEGEILFEFKGHESPIYSIKWYLGDSTPDGFEPLPSNTRWQKDEEEDEDEDDGKFCPWLQS